MPQVSVNIAGRSYRVACEEGEEAHLESLARAYDDKIAEMRKEFGEIGDMRLTVMAALILVDELSETRQRMHRIETEFTGLQHARAAAADQSEALEADIAAAFNSAAERIEKAVRLLGQADNAHQIAIG